MATRKVGRPPKARKVPNVTVSTTLTLPKADGYIVSYEGFSDDEMRYCDTADEVADYITDTDGDDASYKVYPVNKPIEIKVEERSTHHFTITVPMGM